MAGLGGGATGGRAPHPMPHVGEGGAAATYTGDRPDAAREGTAAGQVERCESGRIGLTANELTWETGSEGSNPSLSAAAGLAAGGDITSTGPRRGAPVQCRRGRALLGRDPGLPQEP